MQLNEAYSPEDIIKALQDLSAELAAEANNILSVMVHDLVLIGEQGPAFQLGTPNKIVRDKIVDTLDRITRFVHQAVKNTQISFEVVVVEQTQEDSGVTLLRTPQERLNFIRQNNPSVDLLIKSFDLKLDYD